MTIKIVQGDALEVLKQIKPDCLDACITDPPYHLTSNKESRGGFMGQQWDGGDVAFRAQTWREVYRVLKPGAHLLAFGGTRTYHRMACAIEDAGFEIRDCIMWVYGSGFPKSHNIGAGRGTALKPACEPIALARKPLEGTVAANVLKWGTGALNIDACRISLKENEDLEKLNARSGGKRGFASKYVGGNNHPLPPGADLSKGRWPANLIHDGSEEVVACFPDQTSGGTPPSRPRDKTRNAYGSFGGQENPEGIGPTSGNASRFFYCAKASTKERRGFTHPTVKPLVLMQYLIRLVTPPNGVVLDPFAGTGTTGEAASFETRHAILIELNQSYVEMAQRRCGLIPAQPQLQAAE